MMWLLILLMVGMVFFSGVLYGVGLIESNWGIGVFWMLVVDVVIGELCSVVLVWVCLCCRNYEVLW